MKSPPRNALFLDTFDLTRDARELLKRLQSGEHFDIEDSDFKDDLGRKLLKEVVDKWGLILTRDEEREKGDRARIAIIIGIDAANYCLNNETPLIPSTDNPDGKVSQTQFPGTGLQPRQSQLKTLECEILDRGKSGFRVTMPYDAADPGTLRVGEVICCREPGQQWTPGLIRWMRCIDDSIHFGVQKLADGTRAIAVKPVSTGREDPFKPGLMLHPDRNESSVLHLITPSGLYRNQRNLLVDDGHALLMTRIRKLIDSSETMEWFECETINL